jgi:hypothetical protein
VDTLAGKCCHFPLGSLRARRTEVQSSRNDDLACTRKGRRDFLQRTLRLIRGGGKEAGSRGIAEDRTSKVSLAGVLPEHAAGRRELPAVTLTEVRLMEPRTVGRAVLLPLRWEAAGPAGPAGRPLPVLSGDLIMTEARARNTVLKLDGAFRLPFPAASPATDRAAVRLPQLAAVASTETFMTRIADRLASATRAARNNNQ